MAKFITISNGKPRDESNAFCEHCYELQKGEELYEDGCTWCRVCMDANGWTEAQLNDMRDNNAEYTENKEPAIYIMAGAYI